MKIRPFKISIPAGEILDLKRRLEQTRWLEHIPGAGWSQGTGSFQPDIADPPGLSREDGDVESRFTREELLTTISLYWFTCSMPSTMRIYWEGRRRPLRFSAGERVDVPVAVAHVRHELPMPPRAYVERGYNVARWTEFGSGGHFAAIEETDALEQDIRAFARSLVTVQL